MLEQTPLMKQYFSIKEKYKNAILFFRLGDFYEMFGDDAKKASSVLQITLTSRNKESGEPIPMCGIPYFAADSYISKLISNGYKVAICEQIEDPKKAKGIVKREVVRVITPGTYNPEQPKENTFILSLLIRQGRIGIAVADVSTGEFIVYETTKPIEDEIARFQPREIICPESLRYNLSFQENIKGYYLSYFDDSCFDYSEAYGCLLKHFKVASLNCFGCENMDIAISSAGALINYIEETYRQINFKKITVFRPDSYLFIDSISCKNLEILQNLKDGSSHETLLWVMDETLTPMGGRFLRNALIKPLLELTEINKRQNAVDALIDDFERMAELKALLKGIYDIERLTTKISSSTASPRDVIALRNSLVNIPKIKNLLTSIDNLYLNELGIGLAEFHNLVNLIDHMIVDNPPINPSEGGIIRKGFNSEVDELQEISSSGKDFIARLEVKERQRTSIQSLKIGYNKIFGYFIEITKANLKNVPDNYIRKQTLANCERFITQELKDYETRVLNAEERLKELELQLFQKLIDDIKAYEEHLLNTSSNIAIVDFLLSLAVVAKKYNYNKPVIAYDDKIEIIEGRHPVLERLISKHIISSSNDRFIPNDTILDCSENRLIIITGPNMAGKSTYMRQVALLVLMAQIGSFVPAKSAHIGIVDRIFTRIGAVDFITKGQSTFMVEMTETANILNNATQKSLILLDEVGRGTSTFDGISIAWAVAEYLAKNLKSRTLFATHYHELTDIVFSIEGAKNYNAVVKEWGDEIIFLRKIEKGSADKSYGIQVARLAGLPREVIERAKFIIKKLEGGGFRDSSSLSQLNLFFSGDPIILELLNMDIDSLSPRSAFNKLRDLKKKAEISSRYN